MSARSSSKPIAVIAGVGPGSGLAIARAFAENGFATALLARNLERVQEMAAALPDAECYACDLQDVDSIAATFESILDEMGPVNTLVYNAGSAVFGDITAITIEQFEAAWRVNSLGAAACAKQVLPAMLAEHTGNIIYIGATASRRGGANTAAFAPAKAAQRSLAESMARSLWPNGIHVSLIIVDGVIDSPAGRAYFPDRPAEGFIAPDALARAVFEMTAQDRQAWAFEREVRPCLEPW